MLTWLTTIGSFFTGGGGKIFSFIRGNWKSISILIVIGVLYWYINDLKDQRDNWQDKYREEVQANATLRNNNLNLQTSIDSQNEKIQTLNNKYNQAQDELTELEQTIKLQKEQHKQTIDEIVNEQTPQTCKQSIEYLRESAKELSWED